MKWLSAWWQQIRGHDAGDPWNADPRILAERAAQHERSDSATKLLLRDHWNERTRENWRTDGHHAG